MNDKPTFSPGDDSIPDQQPNQQANYSNQAGGQSAGYQTGARDVLRGLSGLGRKTATASRSNETAAKVKEMMDNAGKALSDIPDKPLLRSVIVEDSQLRIPAITLVDVAGNGKAYYFTILLEALGDELGPVLQPGPGGTQVEIDRPTARYYDDKMRSVVRDRVLKDLSNHGIKADAVETYFGVLPRTVPLDEDRNVYPFYDIAVSCIQSHQRIIAGQPTSNIRADILRQSNIEVVAKHVIDPHSTVESVTGDVLHSDFQITVVARNKQIDHNAVHNVGENAVLTNVVGYLDYVYRGNDPTFTRQLGPQGSVTPTYDPLLVLDEISPLGKSDRTQDDLLTQLLGLTSVIGLATNKRYYTIEMRDSNTKPSVGVFGWEACPYQPAPQGLEPHELKVTNGMAPTGGKNPAIPIRQVMDDYVTPTMNIAMDIKQGGILSWVQSILATAEPGSQSEKLIHDELDAFSNGMWSQQIWDRKQPILAMPSVEHHAGYYRDQDNVVRDLRRIDYKTILEKVKTEKSLVEAYSRALMPGGATADAMQQRKQLIKRLYPSATFTGLHTRVFFNTMFISALGHMLEKLGLSIIMDGISDIDGRDPRAGGLSQAMPLNHAGAFGYYSTGGPSVAAPNFFQSYGFQV